MLRVINGKISIMILHFENMRAIHPKQNVAFDSEERAKICPQTNSYLRISIIIAKIKAGNRLAITPA